MANALEMLGQKEVQLTEAHEQYAALWNVLRQVTEGQISLDRVSVGTDPDGRLSWRVEPLPEAEIRIAEVEEEAEIDL